MTPCFGTFWLTLFHRDEVSRVNEECKVLILLSWKSKNFRVTVFANTFVVSLGLFDGPLFDKLLKSSFVITEGRSLFTINTLQWFQELALRPRQTQVFSEMNPTVTSAPSWYLLRWLTARNFSLLWRLERHEVWWWPGIKPWYHRSTIYTN